MTITVSATGNTYPNWGPKLLSVMKKHLPDGVEEFVHCGIELAKLPLNESKNLASQFSGISMSTPAGDMLIDWTQSISEKGSKKATEWTIDATDFIAHKVAGR